MSIVELRYFRATCDAIVDGKACPKYINVACEPSRDAVAACLHSHKWQTQTNVNADRGLYIRSGLFIEFGEVRCPDHSEAP
jgi:hypothetical protein